MRGLTLCTIGLVGLTTACGADPEELFTAGEAEVGYATIEITYDAVGDEEPRVITASVWYPAQRGDAERAIYEVVGLVELPSQSAFQDATPVAADGAPLVVYSHGSGGQAQLGYPFGEHLASHGWVVVAPDHVGNTAVDFVAGSATNYIRNALDRPADITAVLDRAESGLIDGVDVDASNVMHVGHSFGAYTSLAVGGMMLDVDGFVQDCADTPEEERGDECDTVGNADVEAAFRAGFRDDRVGAIVPQAPAFVSAAVQGSLTDIDVPLMIQSGERDITTTHEGQAVPLWEGTDGADDVWVNIPDGGHYSFITICEDLEPGLVSLFLDDVDNDGCGEDFLPVPDAIASTTALLHAWGNTHILGEGAWDKAIVKGEGWGAGMDIRVRE